MPGTALGWGRGIQLDTEMLQASNFLPMANNQGHHMQGKVVEIGDSAVKMDFNHPLAGMIMHFDGHVHGEGGHQH